MNTVKEVFDKIGGPTKMASAISVKPSAASEMKRRGSIPVRYWPALSKALGVSYKALVEMHVGGP